MGTKDVTDEWKILPREDEGQLIGTLVLMLVPEDQYREKLATGYCNNVTQQDRDGLMAIDPRIVVEREVTFYGGMPDFTISRSWPIPMLSFGNMKDPATKKKWAEFYNLTENEKKFGVFSDAVWKLFKKTSRNHPATKQEEKVRKALMECVMLKVTADLKKEFALDLQLKAPR